MARPALSVYFKSEEHLNRFKAHAALNGVTASDLARDTLEERFQLDSSFFAPSDAQEHQNRVYKDTQGAAA